MNDRDHTLLRIRPNISTIDLEKISLSEESFQNKTVRPILNLQQDIIIGLVKNFLHRHKVNYTAMSLPEKEKFIDLALNRDLKLKYTLLGIVIGHFTVLELMEFNSNSQNLSKRIADLLQQRIIDNIILLDNLED